MRTTVAIDDDVLEAVRGLASVEGKSIGEVLSALARRSLQPATAARSRNGIPLLRVRRGALPVTLEHVNKLRDELK